jgi:hypothetical protein
MMMTVIYYHTQLGLQEMLQVMMSLLLELVEQLWKLLRKATLI